MSKARNLVTNTNKIIGISDKFDPTTGQLGESGDIIPEGNEQKDLGSANNKFRHLYLSSNSIFLGDKTVSADQILDFDLNIAPEVLEIQVAAPDAGQDTSWLWTWLTSSLPYARTTITNQPQGTVPLYKQGTYTINNFAKMQYGSMTQPHTLYFKWIDGAGTQNLISWATDQGTFTDSHPSINDGNDTTVQRYSISVPSTITIPTLTAPSGINYNVTNNASGAYTFSGSASGDNINIGPLYRGGTYTFTVNASGHPLYLTTDNGTNFSSGTYFGEYLSGVTNSRTDSGTLTFVVPNDAPDTLYYQCGNHGPMRGAVTIKDLAVETNNNGNYIVYAQHTQEGHKTPIELRPIPSLTSQMCIVYDASINKFVPQDLATYVENTPSFKNKIQEVAGTAELVVEDGSTVIAKVNVYDDSTYLPLVGNNPGDQAFATDTDILYIWDGSAWQQAGASNSDDLTEGTTNLFYTDARVDARLASGNVGLPIKDSSSAEVLAEDINGVVTLTADIANVGSATISGGSISGTEIDLKSSGTTIFASDGTTAVLSESAGVVTLTADAAVIEGSSSGDLVRITQTGTGNALVVEDEANPDSSPFVIDSDGHVISGAMTDVTPYSSLTGFRSFGTDATRYVAARYIDSSVGPNIYLLKSRSPEIGQNTIVNSGDTFGAIIWMGADGDDYVAGAQIDAKVDGTPGTNDMPGRLVFSTTADGESSPTERMHIDSSGNVNVSSNLTVSGIVSTNELRQRTGQQLILNAGEAAGKFSGQTNEYVYVNAESGLMVSTPDRSHSNFQAGYTQDTTVIRGEKITVNGNTVWHAGNDGSGSGLDADLLDGAQPSVTASNNTIVKRHSSGYIFANYFNTTPNDVTSGVTKVCVETGNDGYIRHGTQAAIRAFIGAGSGNGLDADKVDGLQASQFLRSDATDSFTNLSGTSITLGSGVKLQEASHRADLLLVQSQTSGWAGIQIDNTANETLWSLMANGTTFGIYDDTSNIWSIQCLDSGETRLYYNGSEKLNTDSNGIAVTGQGIRYYGISGASPNRIAFRWSLPHLIGRVDDAQNVTIGTASDYRIKTNVAQLEGGLSIIKLLNPIKYNPVGFDGIVDTDTELTGLIAHEVQEVRPSVVSGEKDGVNENGDPEYQSVYYAGLVPDLIKAIQEQQDQIDALTARIEALEAGN